MTRPATMVATGAPLKVRPSNGEFRDLLGDSFTSYVQESSREKIVRLAACPAAILLSMPRIRAGPEVKSSTILISDRRPEGDNCLRARARAGSKPRIPKGGGSKST